jgi:peptide/nickel transport system permease protein
MTASKILASAVLGLIAASALCPALITPMPYDRQFREFPNAPPSAHFLLGTDNVGRDRMARLLYGTRVSLIAAPCAALLSTALAALAGSLAGFLGGWWDRTSAFIIGLMLSLPSLFLLILLRAALPLNVPPTASLVLTFGLIGVLGWPAAARVVRAAVFAQRYSDAVLYAAACGERPSRILLRHILPGVRSVLAAKFWASIPVFILAEANLGLLGLGVADPLPSWGNLLRELESGFGRTAAAWSPLALVVIVVGCLHVLRPSEDFA